MHTSTSGRHESSPSKHSSTSTTANHQRNSLIYISVYVPAHLQFLAVNVKIDLKRFENVGVGTYCVAVLVNGWSIGKNEYVSLVAEEQ